MSANVDAMVREGVNAYKSGRKDEARSLLLKASELDPYNEQAWLWLSGLMDSPDDQRTCLENVLAINPENERAKQGLSYLTGQTSAGNVSPFAASATPPPAYASDTPPAAYSSGSTSVEWSAPNDAPPTPPTPAWASALATPAEPVGEALDDWVSNLNLPVTDLPSDAFSASPSSPFGDFDLDDDDFGGGPFSGTPLSLDDDDEKPATLAAPSRRSPVPTGAPEVSPTPRRKRKPRGEGSLLTDADKDRDGVYFESGEGEMFGYIPPEIPATRLPGTNERTPILLTISMVVLVVLNLALGVIIMLNIFT
ncbi:MAG: hypothetical protein U0521_12135 [Anaerolineae bacterium]